MAKKKLSFQIHLNSDYRVFRKIAFMWKKLTLNFVLSARESKNFLHRSAQPVVQLTKWGELKVDHASLRTLNNWKITIINKVFCFFSCLATARVATIRSWMSIWIRASPRKRMNEMNMVVCLSSFLGISGKLWSRAAETMPFWNETIITACSRAFVCVAVGWLEFIINTIHCCPIERFRSKKILSFVPVHCLSNKLKHRVYCRDRGKKAANELSFSGFVYHFSLKSFHFFCDKKNVFNTLLQFSQPDFVFLAASSVDHRPWRVKFSPKRNQQMRKHNQTLYTKKTAPWENEVEAFFPGENPLKSLKTIKFEGYQQRN